MGTKRQDNKNDLQTEDVEHAADTSKREWMGEEVGEMEKNTQAWETKQTQKGTGNKRDRGKVNILQ